MTDWSPWQALRPIHHSSDERVSPIPDPLVAEDDAMLPIVAKRFAPEVIFTSRLLRPRGDPLDRVAEAFGALLRGEAQAATRRHAGA